MKHNRDRLKGMSQNYDEAHVTFASSAATCS